MLGGSSVYGSETTPVVTNSIIWDIGSDLISGGEGAVISPVTYSTVRGGYDGDGNLSQDPLFANTPLATTFTTGYGERNTAIVEELAELPEPGDFIEIDDDGVLRTVVSIEDATILFEPMRDEALRSNRRVDIFGPENQNLEVDLRLLANSPAIDRGNDNTAFPLDFDGLGWFDDPDAQNCGDAGLPDCSWFSDQGAFEKGGTETDVDPFCDSPMTYSGNGHRYRHCPLPICIDSARAYCLDLGGHLATIRDSEENAFVQGMITQPIWLAASDYWENQNWVWTTGEEWSYDNWAEGEPAGSNVLDCSVMSDADGTWREEDCDSEMVHYFVCEQE
jgi:hypothetical protein